MKIDKSKIKDDGLNVLYQPDNPGKPVAEYVARGIYSSISLSLFAN
jgi:hypothetical protein